MNSGSQYDVLACGIFSARKPNKGRKISETLGLYGQERYRKECVAIRATLLKLLIIRPLVGWSSCYQRSIASGGGGGSIRAMNAYLRINHWVYDLDRQCAQRKATGVTPVTGEE